ncbi:UDP-N-acetylglucosamine 2-epimerase (non-hydrolysing) [Paraoerskovia marina]|uniref:UDP-N-acetylglucosamine 2-epimerase (non-hydrolyzing) n=1 Tax=Paraoerskovia marina TaxID=545619 RepID=A0A1H1Q8H2_9CELL|nr:UDP-N-acetylglucosamine 2-epimerase (non-hydrolyzing) [Paraoerskovia marina]SDS19746.1 UDP-N-acetylglucosamine 2-epimerase (non-hydrolysing) [Paraoerskovia marina]
MVEESRALKVMTVYGTRPEAIKVAPVVLGLEADDRFESVAVVTGQHREMLDQVNELFGITPDFDLDVFEHGSSLSTIVARVLERLDPILVSEAPDAVIVQGDTSTSTAAALAAFHRQIPVMHLEAGLRSGNIDSPFPEEANRQVTTRLAALHLAPTTTSRDNLLVENVDPALVLVTGNTVIDALLTTVDKHVPFTDPQLEALSDPGARILLVTTHRRENWDHMGAIGRAVARLARQFPDVQVVLPAHRNPIVREAVLPPLAGLDNVTVVEPLAYGEFTRMLAMSSVILTDSGGVQEEAPSLAKPVLVLRENTERPEAMEAGTVRLIGTDEQRIVDEVSRLLADDAAYAEMANATNPYGDGHATPRILDAIEKLLTGR